MSHTTNLPNNKGVIIHNSDYSGTVTIKQGGQEYEIPGPLFMLAAAVALGGRLSRAVDDAIDDAMDKVSKEILKLDGHPF